MINIKEKIKQMNGNQLTEKEILALSVPEKGAYVDKPRTNETLKMFQNFLAPVLPPPPVNPEDNEGRALVNRAASNYSNPAVDALRSLVKELSDKISAAQANADSAQRSVDKLWESGEIRSGMKAYTGGTLRETVVDFILMRKQTDGHAQALPAIVDPDKNKFVTDFANNYLKNINDFADRRDSFKKDIVAYQQQLKKANEDLAEALKNLTPEERAQEEKAAEEVKQQAANRKIKTAIGWILLGTLTAGGIAAGIVFFKQWKKKKLGK